MATRPTVINDGSNVLSSNSGSVTVPSPSSLAAGDLILILFTSTTFAGTASSPGFTVAYQDSGAAPTGAVLSKIATSSEPSSYVVSSTSNLYFTATAFAVRGADPANLTIVGNRTDAGYTVTAPAATVSTGTSLRLNFWAGYYSPSDVITLTGPPSGYASVAYGGTGTGTPPIRVSSLPAEPGQAPDSSVSTNSTAYGRGVTILVPPSPVPNVTGGNPATVTHTSTGGGDVGFSGGSVAAVAHTPSGSFTAAATGGAAATVTHAGAGTGYPAITGGAATTVQHVATASAAVGVFTVRVGGTEYPATFAGVWNGTATVPATTQAKP